MKNSFLDMIKPFSWIIYFVLFVIFLFIALVAVHFSSSNDNRVKGLSDLPPCDSSDAYSDLQNLYQNNQNPLWGKISLVEWTNAKEVSTSESPMIERDCSATGFFDRLGQQNITFRMYFVHSTDSTFFIESKFSD